jgi:hypothetical protein
VFSYCNTSVKGLGIQDIGQQKECRVNMPNPMTERSDEVIERKETLVPHNCDDSGLSGWNRAPSDADVSLHHVMQDSDRDYVPGNDIHRGCMSYLNTGSHWQKEKENLNDANR